ncbi:MAG: NADH-quinone oxidoreductase subunit C [Actinomycetota bacterium]|nr:NADH-quinone oxidoreductase subunit C [Actinomycetota bacterium]
MPVVDRVSPEDALQRASALLGDRARVVDNHGQLDVTCTQDQYVSVVDSLADDVALRCNFFTFLTGVDRSEVADNAGPLEVLVHLYSPEHVVHANIHVPLDADKPRCPSLTYRFHGALWHERECHEMFGVVFEGHPSLVNLLLPEDFTGHPLLRSFKLPSRQVKEWPGAKDPEEAAAGGR